MAFGKIKSDWACVTVTGNKEVVVSYKNNGAANSVVFRNSEMLRQCIKQKRISVKKWAVNIPWSSCIQKTIKLPASDLGEAYRMIEFELPSLVPVPLDNIVYGCTLKGKQDNFFDLLVFIVKLTVINEYKEAMKSAGISPCCMISDYLSMRKWFNGSTGGKAGAQLNIFIKKEDTHIFGHDEKIYDLREMARDEIVNEVSHEIKRLSGQSGEAIIVTIAGAAEKVPYMEALLREKFGELPFVRIIAKANPQIGIYQEDVRQCSGDDFVYEAAAGAGLLELAVKSEYKYCNLLPRGDIARAREKALLINYMITFCLVLLLLCSLWVTLWSSNRRIRTMSSMYEAKIKPIEKIAGGVEKKRQRVNAIKAQLVNRGRISQILSELYKYTPEYISISELRLTAQGVGITLEMKGQADTLSNAFDYTNAMNKAVLLSKIQLIDAQQIPRPGGSIVEFKADCAVRDN